MTDAEKLLHAYAPDLPLDHLVSFAIEVGSTLPDKPPAFFKEVALLAASMGAEQLAERFYNATGRRDHAAA